MGGIETERDLSLDSTFFVAFDLTHRALKSGLAQASSLSVTQYRVLERAEKTAVDTAVMNMRSGLRLEKARRIVAGERLRDLAGVNPLRFLEEPFVGQIPIDLINSTNSVKSGVWQYKSDENALYYVPQRRRHLKMQQDNVDKALVWQVLPSTSDGEQVEVVLMTPYWWF